MYPHRRVFITNCDSVIRLGFFIPSGNKPGVMRASETGKNSEFVHRVRQFTTKMRICDGEIQREMFWEISNCRNLSILWFDL